MRSEAVDNEESLEGKGVGRAIHRFRRWLGYKILPGTDAEHAAQARFMAQGELERAYREIDEPAFGEAYRALSRYVPVPPHWERENDEVSDA